MLDTLLPLLLVCVFGVFVYKHLQIAIPIQGESKLLAIAIRALFRSPPSQIRIIQFTILNSSSTQRAKKRRM